MSHTVMYRILHQLGWSWHMIDGIFTRAFVKIWIAWNSDSTQLFEKNNMS